jgi:very-short-patch-repair endonuclease
VHALRARAVMTRVGCAVVSHTSAAVLWQLPMRAEDYRTVHVSPSPGRRGHPKSGPGYHVHTAVVPSERVLRLAGLPTTDALRTVLDCATVVSADWAVAIGDAALHRGLVTPQALASAARATRRIKGAARVRSLATLCSPDAESPGESLLRLRLRRMGLEAVEQHEIAGVGGRPRVDFLVAGRLIVEFDGRAKYTIDGDPARAHWEEKRRQDRLVEAGFTVLRVVWADLWDEAALERRVHRALVRVSATH